MRSFIYAYAVVLSVALMIVFSTGTTVAAITCLKTGESRSGTTIICYY